MSQLRIVENEASSAAGDGYLHESLASQTSWRRTVGHGAGPMDSSFVHPGPVEVDRGELPFESAAQVLSRSDDHLASVVHHNQRLLANNVHLQALLLERTREIEESRHAANHDDLTGLCNRRTLPEHLGQALAHAKQYHQSLALAMLDLNGFRHVNERFGHVAGDRVLRTLAKRIALNVGALDTVCRYGGDEFVLILPDMDRAAAMRTVEKVVEEVAKPCALDGYAVSLSVSAGVALYPRDSTDAVKLLEAADKAMYRQKPHPGLMGKPKIRLRWFLTARDGGNVGNAGAVSD